MGMCPPNGSTGCGKAPETVGQQSCDCHLREGSKLLLRRPSTVGRNGSGSCARREGVCASVNCSDVYQGPSPHFTKIGACIWFRAKSKF